MEEEGVIVRLQNRRYAAPSKIPPVGVIEAIRVDDNGELYGKPIGWQTNTSGIAIVVSSSRRNARNHNLGIGQRALVRLKQIDKRGIGAHIMRVLPERKGTLIGIVEKKKGYTEIKSVNRRGPTNVRINNLSETDIQNGDIIQVELEGEKLYGEPQGILKKVLGNFGKPGSPEIIICAELDIPTEFSKASISECLTAGPPEPKGREDLTSIPLVTIDDEDARDFDDAVWAEPDTSENNLGGWNLMIAIADVAAYVKPGSALDKEAQDRGNSVYLPSKVIPMLPEALSNDWCSLKPGEDRACVAVRISINKEGNTLNYRFIRGIMRSGARLTYSQVQAHRNGTPSPQTESLGEQLDNLYGAYTSLKRARKKRKTLDFDLPEKKITLGKRGEVVSVDARPIYESHKLIEEFMIVANVVAAEALTSRKAPCLYRTHDQPPQDKTETLRSYLKELGYKLSRTQQLRPQHFQQILDKSRGTKHSDAIALMILRSQSQAEYSPHNVGHFGLNIELYSHFTSPIRRYSDLLIHRSLISQLNLGPGGASQDLSPDLPDIGTHLSQTERRAANAERSATDRYMTLFMADKVGANFMGKISGVTKFGLFVSLTETHAEGLIPIRILGQQLGERVRYDSFTQILTAKRARMNFKLGDEISVRIEDANKITSALTFSLSELEKPRTTYKKAKSYRRRRPGR